MKQTHLGRIIRGAPVACAALAAFWAASAPLAANAALPGSAGNTIVRNTITVNYNDARGAVQAAVSATVDLTVTTVAATPTVVSFTPSPGSTDGAGATQAYSVRVRTNSNGPGTVSFGATDGSFSAGLSAGAVPTVAGSIFLGATVIDPSEAKKGSLQTVAAGASITFAVPNDGGVPTATAVTGGATGDGVINGLTTGDIVYITDGTTPYGPFNVTAVTDPAVGAGATAAPGSITLNNGTGSSIAFTPQLGWQIVEAKDVAAGVTVTQGAIAIGSAMNPQSWVTTFTATMTGAAGGTGTVTTNAHTGLLSIAKYVRNVTTPVVGSGTQLTPAVTVNGTSSNLFYPSGVSGKPGDVLEYLAVVTDAGTGNSTAVYATDVTPTYTTLVSGTTYGSATAGLIFAKARFNGTETDLKTDNTGGALNIGYGKTTVAGSVTTMTFYLGTGSNTTTGGTLATTQAEYLLYQVKIN